MAEILDVVESGISIDRDSVLNRLCVHAEIVDVQPSGPGDLRVGQSANLRVTAGYHFNQDPNGFGRPLLVTVTGAGSVSPGHTDAQGMYSTTIVPSALVVGVSACFDESGLPHLSKVCGSRQLPTSTATTTTLSATSTTTSTTLSGSSVTPISRNVVSSVQATTLDRPVNCCSDFFSTIALPAGPLTTQVDDTGVFSGTASAHVDRHDSSASSGAGGSLTRITDAAHGSGQLHTTVFSTPPTYGVGALGGADLQYEFQVNQPTSFHITASVTVDASSQAGSNGDLRSSARVVLQHVNSGAETFTLSRSASAGVGGPQGGGTASDEASGMLNPARYRLRTVMEIRAFTAGALDQSQMGSTMASYDVTLSLGP